MRLKELRKKKHMTQQRLAIELSMSQNTISRYETGEREADYKTLILLADYFQVSLGYLMGKEEPVPFVNVPPTKEQLYTFLFGTPTISDEAAEEVMAYARYVAQREKEAYLKQNIWRWLCSAVFPWH